jgi:hypothetical protein
MRKKNELQVVDDQNGIDKLPIELTGERRQKHNEAVKDVNAFARYGSMVLRVKAQTLAALGKEAEKAGIKQIGHGRVLVASENAENAIATLGALAQDMIKVKPTPNHEVILEIMQLVREFNHQLIVTAQMHIVADRQVSMEPAAQRSSLPPPNATVTIAIAKENGNRQV